VQREAPSSPSARPPLDQIVLAGSMRQRDPAERAIVPPRAQKRSEPPRTIERRRTRSRVAAPALVARAVTPTAPVPVPRAPPASSAGFHGALLVVSDPPGARVFVNGRLVGSTPLDLPDVPVGSRVVRVEADGYEAWASAIRVVANQQTRVDASLRR
jgi:PEGA domain